MQGVQRYCEAVSADILHAQSEETRRKALCEYVDKIVFEKGIVSILGAVPIEKSGDDADEVGYRTDGRIEQPSVPNKIR